MRSKDARHYGYTKKPIFLKIALSIPDWGFNEVHSVAKYLFCNRINSHAIITELEKRICSILKVRFCIATALGREALYVALKTLGIQKGDGVILPSFACRSILDPILSLGGTPQFADIGGDLNIDPKSVIKQIDGKTKVILMPHLFGKSAKVDSITKIARENDLYVIDDAAQALGGKYGEECLGTIGDFGILSFGPFKGIMATRGCALLTNNEELYQKAKQIFVNTSYESGGVNRFLKYFLKFRMRKYSYFLIEWLKKDIAGEESQNDLTKHPFTKPLKRISRIDANLVLCQLSKLTEIIDRRRKIASQLLALLRDIPEVKLPVLENDDHVFSKFVLSLGSNIAENRLSTAEALVKYLRYHGVEAEPWCYIPLHLNNKFNTAYDLRKTEMIWKGLVGLPIHTKMSHSDVLYMSKVVRSFFE
jgi:dTDP-4-amino-4,6-dideoxygalactose transaminase